MNASHVRRFLLVFVIMSLMFLSHSIYAQDQPNFNTAKTSDAKIGKFAAAAKLLYGLNTSQEKSAIYGPSTVQEKSPKGCEMMVGYNLNNYHTISLAFTGYEVCISDITRVEENGGLIIIGGGWLLLRHLGLNYKLGLGVLNDQSFYQNTFLSFGVAVADWSPEFISFSLTPEYKIRVSKSISIPIGFKYMLEVNPPNDRFEKWNFLGIQAGIAYN